MFDSANNKVRLSSYYCSTQSQFDVPYGALGVNNGEWHYYALTIDRYGNVQLYIDGLKSTYGVLNPATVTNWNDISFILETMSFWIDELMIAKELVYTDEFIPPTLPWG